MISEMLPEEKRRLYELEQQLVELERGSGRVQVSDVSLGLTEMSQRLDELDRLAVKEPKAKVQDYQRRVQHLRTAHGHIRSSLDSLVRRRDRENNNSNNSSYLNQRRELFGEAGERGGDGGVGGDVDLELAESASLSRSSRLMGDYLATGQETLSELTSQRERLKGVQRKVFDIMNYLGLSNSIMRSVERREIVDKWIVYAGMLVTLVLLFCVWWFWGGKKK